MKSFYYFGNEKILKLKKTAFLCSRKSPAEIVLKSYDWAIEQRKKAICVISGFHSKIEKDVFHFLLKGSQPIILALARGLMKKNKPAIKLALENKNLLIVSPFNSKINHITQQTAYKRNKFMCDLADEIFIAYASPNSYLINLIKHNIDKGKKISAFDNIENEHLFDLKVIRFKNVKHNFE